MKSGKQYCENVIKLFQEFSAIIQIQYLAWGEDMKMGRLIGQGRTAEIYALEDNKVLKLFRADMAHKSVEREYTLGKILAEIGVPAPAVYEMVTVEVRQGIIYEHISGKTMLDVISSRPHAAIVEARRLARLHHEIHLNPAIGLESHKHTLAENISRVTSLSARERQLILDSLDTLPSGNMLCHGDFHPDNIMLASNKTVVLDWMNAVSGSPAGDVARTILLLRDAAPPPGLAGWKLGMLRFLRKAFFSSYIREYYRISEITPAQVEPWILPVAAARLSEELPRAELETLMSIVRSQLR